jgi:iron complex transport system substrate-binding protein
MSASIADTANAGDALTNVEHAYEDKLAALASTYSSALKDNAWVHYSFGDSDGQFSVQFPTRATGALLAAVGANVAHVISTAQPKEGYKSYSLEQADVLKDATVGVFPLDAAGKEFPALAATRSSGVWRNLPLHDSGQDFGLVLFTGVSTYTSAVAALDEFETKILKKLAS